MAALFNKKRKGKVVAESSNEAPRFKTPFHEAHFKGKLSARKVLPELAIDYNDEILSPCAMQIKTRKWEKLTSPLPAVGHNLVKEFYANAWEPDKAKRKPYNYTTMVQGKDISFAPSNIKRVLRLMKDPLPNATSYEERKANKDYRLEEVLECLCLEGREWFYKFIYKTDLSSSLPFPSIIAALCLDAKVVPHKDDTMIPQEMPIAGEAMMGNETMYYPNQNTARQFREMEAQDVLVTIANLAIHRHREEEMNRERMRHNQTVQEAASQRTREANKGKAREVVPDSEEEESEEMYSSPSEEW
ncbi:hypothetical protein PIB30_076671 [Stylosanthes scabra]|uniref:Putative plant transposon protein domain-containing protein n=1 Tax=Stylosanthes scabra TaxID=79078 RepID=A0ABU6WPZ7_9FABA|nr:hypothetical protein [Stylosanthes scabra]